jgi:hypothetical protein
VKPFQHDSRRCECIEEGGGGLLQSYSLAPDFVAL